MPKPIWQPVSLTVAYLFRIRLGSSRWLPHRIGSTSITTALRENDICPLSGCPC
jgi:hypothetical protein